MHTQEQRNTTPLDHDKLNSTRVYAEFIRHTPPTPGDDDRFATIVPLVANFQAVSTFVGSEPARAMIEYGTEPGWLSVAEASRILRISETAVRKRIRTGAIPTREHQGRKQVRILVEPGGTSGSQPDSSTGFNQERSLEAARLAGEVAALRERLVDVQRDRDRWHQLALETRDEARAAQAERAALERELRLLLART